MLSQIADVNPDDAKKSLGDEQLTMEITNIGTQGPILGSGKTSVLDLAMGKEPATTRTSTDCVDPPSRYLMIDIQIQYSVSCGKMSGGRDDTM